MPRWFAWNRVFQGNQRGHEKGSPKERRSLRNVNHSRFHIWNKRLFPLEYAIGRTINDSRFFLAVYCVEQQGQLSHFYRVVWHSEWGTVQKKCPDSENRVPREPFSSPSPPQLVELPARYAIQKMMSHGLFLPFHEKRSMIVFPSWL